MNWGLFLQEQDQNIDKTQDIMGLVERKNRIQQQKDWGTNVPQPIESNLKAQKEPLELPKKEWKSQNEISQQIQQYKPN